LFQVVIPIRTTRCLKDSACLDVLGLDGRPGNNIVLIEDSSADTSVIALSERRGYAAEQAEPPHHTTL
jgi:hypothetical protein